MMCLGCHKWPCACSEEQRAGLEAWLAAKEHPSPAPEPTPPECAVPGCGRHVGDCPHAARVPGDKFRAFVEKVGPLPVSVLAVPAPEPASGGEVCPTCKRRENFNCSDAFHVLGYDLLPAPVAEALPDRDEIARLIANETDGDWHEMDGHGYKRPFLEAADRVLALLARTEKPRRNPLDDKWTCEHCGGQTSIFTATCGKCGLEDK